MGFSPWDIIAATSREGQPTAGEKRISERRAYDDGRRKNAAARSG